MSLGISAADSGALVCVIVSMGMGAAFLFADFKSVTTRLLAGFLILVGLSIFFNVRFVRPGLDGELHWASVLTPLLTSLSMILAAEWILRIRRMVPAGNLRTLFGDMQFRLAQFFAAAYGVIGMHWNELRVEAFIGVSRNPELLMSWGFWMFAGPFTLFLLFIVDGVLITLRRKPDRPELVRLIGIAAASPLIGAGLVLPNPLASYSSALGQMIFLIAAVQYHVMQGQRGQFLRRFLSPSVADLVRREGLQLTMQQTKLPVAAVACDLRGYTDFSASRDSHDVITVLQDFYDLVGEEAGRHGATIKDYAGDGVLLLLGAPLPVDDHVAKALELSAHIRQRCQQHFADNKIDLGIGIGIASGVVSVGVIGQQRLEYVAVGQAVNLAARLCQNAARGEILLDDKTRDQLPDVSDFTSGERMQLKGFIDPIQTWLMPPALPLNAG
ncbi:MAG: adenylate/guanylate cyclase domain-containing protein [Oceanococcus sp.]